MTLRHGLGALELSLPGIDVDVPGGTTGHLIRPGKRTVAFTSGADQAETAMAVSMLNGLVPGAADLMLALVRELIEHPTIASMLHAATGDDEAGVAAAHGAVYLGLAVVVAAAVMRSLPARLMSFEASVVGLALGCANIVLREVPMPDSYAAAVLAKRRAKYLYPRQASCVVEVHDHRFALAGDPNGITAADFTANGLVTAIDGGVVIRTGVEEGQVRCALIVLAEPELEPELNVWDEVVDISWHTATGDATLPLTRRPGSRHEHVGTPPWPGDYRLRVYATGRDDDSESYRLVIWQEPASAEVVHRRTDRLGYRLRGESEPDIAPAPEAAYRWVEDGWFYVAATYTVVTGMSQDEVIRVFGGDPDAPFDMDEHDGVPAIVLVASIGDAVLAVEPNGYQGGYVLERLSANGTAASMFWNVNGVTSLGFARNGTMLAQFEPFGDEDRSEPDVAEALAGLDFDDDRHKHAKGVTAVTRFTGHDFTEADVQAMVTANIAYVIGS